MGASVSKQSEAALNYMLESVRKFVDIVMRARNFVSILSLFLELFFCYALAAFLIWEIYGTCTN